MTSMLDHLRATDPVIAALIEQEAQRQRNGLEMIASENFTSRAVMEAQGSILTNKYAEGLPGKRYYGGCEFVDQIEQLAIERALQLFGAEAANVQLHSGAQANVAVYSALLKPGDSILGMRLDQGGHLTHGSPVNYSGKVFNAHFYGVDPQSGLIDYDDLLEKAKAAQPKLITSGASAYPRQIDFARMRRIADEVGAILLADIAHTAGLVAGGEHPTPVGHAQVITTTTHKTLRGARGGMIMMQADLAKVINSSVFPGTQGGPLMHTIAGKAVAFAEALQPEFKVYAQQIRRNAKALAAGLTARGLRLISGGTDNHLVLLDVGEKGLTGVQVQNALDHAGITVNKNAIPDDKQSPMKTSGIRIGVAAVTTRGLTEREMAAVADWVADVIEQPTNTALLQQIQRDVADLVQAFPVPVDRVKIG